ncbi:MAG: type VII secretion protein EccB, partial [Gordonia sp. (in: high G+C Gram-positive bacteria)]
GDWLLYRSPLDDAPVRARIDTGSVATMRALGIEGARPRPVSEALLNVFPAAPSLTTPEMPRLGEPGPSALSWARVGTVVKSVGVDGVSSYFVVLAGGLQRVSRPAAEMLRMSGDSPSSEVRTVSPADLARVPTVVGLPLQSFPDAAPRLVADDAVLCRSWRRDRGQSIAAEQLVVARGLPLPAGSRAVTLSSADGSGPGLDGVYLPPGSGEYLLPVGTGPRAAPAEAAMYVGDAGVRYPLAGDGVAQMLGLPAEPALVPWPVVALLPAGPQLSREAALVAHDVAR